MTLELFRRGAHAVVSREVEPDMLVECLRKVSRGEPWLEARAIGWVLEAYRTQGIRPAGSRPKVQLTPKESLIVSCVTQGMKNKEIAVKRRHDGTGRQELSAQSVRQAGRGRSSGTRALLPESSRRPQRACRSETSGGAGNRRRPVSQVPETTPTLASAAAAAASGSRT